MLAWRDIEYLLPELSQSHAALTVNHALSETSLKLLNLLIEPLLTAINEYSELDKNDRNALNQRKERLETISLAALQAVHELQYSRLKSESPEYLQLLDILKKIKAQAELKADYLKQLDLFYQENPSGVAGLKPGDTIAPENRSIIDVPKGRLNLSMSPLYLVEEKDPLHRPTGGITNWGVMLTKWRAARETNPEIADYFMWLETTAENELDNILTEGSEQTVYYAQSTEEKRQFKLSFTNSGTITQQNEPLLTANMHDEMAAFVLISAPITENASDDSVWMLAHEHITGQHHHSSFNGGKPVIGAGMISIDPKTNKINKITNKSGHYAPGLLEMKRVIEFLQSKNALSDDCEISCQYTPSHSTSGWSKTLHVEGDVKGFLDKVYHKISKYGLYRKAWESASDNEQSCSTNSSPNLSRRHSLDLSDSDVDANSSHVLGESSPCLSRKNPIHSLNSDVIPLLQNLDPIEYQLKEAIDNVNQYLKERAMATKHHTSCLFGYSAKDYHARRDSWNKIVDLLVLSTDIKQDSKHYLKLLKKTIVEERNKFSNGNFSNKYADKLSTLLEILSLEENNITPIQAHCPQETIVQTKKLLNLQNKSRIQVNKFRETFFGSNKHILSSLTKKLNAYDTEMAGNNNFLSRAELKEAEYNNYYKQP